MSVRDQLIAQLERHEHELAAFYRRLNPLGKKPRETRYSRGLWAEIESLISRVER